MNAVTIWHQLTIRYILSKKQTMLYLSIGSLLNKNSESISYFTAVRRLEFVDTVSVTILPRNFESMSLGLCYNSDAGGTRMEKERTLAEEAEAWWLETHNELPVRDTKEWHEMYETWVNFAFGPEMTIAERRKTKGQQ
jgi:hypothetical protein